MSDQVEMWLAVKSTKYRRTIEELRNELKQISNQPRKAIEISLNIICDTMHVQAGTFWFYDKDGDGLIHPQAQYGGSDSIADISLKPGEGIAGKVIESGKSTLIDDCQKDERWAKKIDKKTGFMTNSMICVPIFDNNELFGCIQLINKVDNSLFDREDLEFSENLATVISNEFKNLKIMIDSSPKETVILYVDFKGYENIINNLELSSSMKMINGYYDTLFSIAENNRCSDKMFTENGLIIAFRNENINVSVNNAIQTSISVDKVLSSTQTQIEKEYGYFLGASFAIDLGQIYFGDLGKGANKEKGIIGTPVFRAINLAKKHVNKEIIITENINKLIDETIERKKPLLSDYYILK